MSFLTMYVGAVRDAYVGDPELAIETNTMYAYALLCKDTEPTVET